MPALPDGGPLTKDQVSSDYMEKMKAEHAHKQLPNDRKVLVIGAQDDNIGDTIAYKLSESMQVMTPTQEQFDVRSPDERWLKGFDTLILCNGYTRMDWIEDANYHDIGVTVATNLTGNIVTISEFVRQTINDPHRKTIIVIGSMAYNHVLNASAAYCASKAGLAHYVKCAGWELAPKGYNVYGVHPSNVEGTPMTEETIRGIMRVRGISRSAAQNYWAAVNPQAAWLQASDVAETVAYLASGQALYQTGTNIELSGGQR